VLIIGLLCVSFKQRCEKSEVKNPYEIYPTCFLRLWFHCILHVCLYLENPQGVQTSVEAFPLLNGCLQTTPDLEIKTCSKQMRERCHGHYVLLFHLPLFSYAPLWVSCEYCCNVCDDCQNVEPVNLQGPCLPSSLDTPMILSGRDPDTASIVPLTSTRQWHRGGHFEWSEEPSRRTFYISRES